MPNSQRKECGEAKTSPTYFASSIKGVTMRLRNRGVGQQIDDGVHRRGGGHQPPQAFAA